MVYRIQIDLNNVDYKKKRGKRMTEEVTKPEKPSISIKEFKFWLEGVEEMQAEGWTPDPRQWARIREKINQLYEVHELPVQQPQYNQPVYRAPVQEQIPHFPQVPTVFDGIPVAPGGFQQAPGGLGGGGHPVIPNLTGPFAREQGNIPVRTPDIDTTNGYQSSFQ